MPSKIIKKGEAQFYAREGGAWKKTRWGFMHVGAGHGNYSKRSKKQDARRYPKKRKYINAKLAKKYPQAYDTPAQAKRAKEWKKKAKKKKKKSKKKKHRR